MDAGHTGTRVRTRNERCEGAGVGTVDEGHERVIVGIGDERCKGAGARTRV